MSFDLIYAHVFQPKVYIPFASVRPSTLMDLQRVIADGARTTARKYATMYAEAKSYIFNKSIPPNIAIFQCTRQKFRARICHDISR